MTGRTAESARPGAGRRLPDLGASFPGPFPVSPHAADVAGQLAQWLATYPLIASERARAALCDITGHGVARTFPAAGLPGLTACADLLLWLTAFDDAYGETTGAQDPAALVRRVAGAVRVLDGGVRVFDGGVRVFDGAVRVLDGPDAPGGVAGATGERPPVGPVGPDGPDGDAFEAALADVMARVRELATPEQCLRVAAAVRDSLFGLVWEAHELAAGGRVAVPEYRAMRPYTVFVRTVAALAEPVLGYELPRAERESYPVRELESAVSHLAGWINDLASYDRERKRAGGAAPFSLPTLMAAEEGYGIEAAFAAVSTLCEAEAARARARITELTAGAPAHGPGAPDTARAAHARAWEGIAASYVWHIGHGRYGGAGGGAGRPG